MKNKTLTFILLAVVGFIWYKVFFRVKDNLFGAGNETVIETQQATLTLTPVERDTFQLNADYRDPFGETKTYRVSIPAPPPVPAQAVTRPSNPAPQDVWPAISYFGQLRKIPSSHPLGIISIDGYNHAIRKGDELYDGILIRSVTRDSVVIQYKKKTKAFYRN